MASPEEVFAFHERPGAVKELTPPWERMEVLSSADSLKPGSRVIFRMRFGPFSRRWVAEHTEYIRGRLFVDVQVQGPFAYWLHRHHFDPSPHGTTIMTDDIEYALPLGRFGEVILGPVVRRRLQRMFDYRHETVAEKMGRPRPA